MRKSAKQAVWIAIGLWTGFTFVGCFTPIRELAAAGTSFSLGPWESFWVLFYGFATYGNAGFMREQVCKYMCLYELRFSGARSFRCITAPWCLPTIDPTPSQAFGLSCAIGLKRALNSSYNSQANCPWGRAGKVFLPIFLDLRTS